MALPKISFPIEKTCRLSRICHVCGNRFKYTSHEFLLFAWSPDLPEQDWSVRGLPDIRYSLISGWEGMPDLHEQDLLSFSENQAIRQTSQICEMSKVRIMVIKIHVYLINFFRACFLHKWHSNLPKYYKFNCRNYGNWRIRHCLISGYLIDQAPSISKSGGTLIDPAGARSKSSSCLINQDPGLW